MTPFFARFQLTRILKVIENCWSSPLAHAFWGNFPSAPRMPICIRARTPTRGNDLIISANLAGIISPVHYALCYRLITRYYFTLVTLYFMAGSWLNLRWRLRQGCVTFRALPNESLNLFSVSLCSLRPAPVFTESRVNRFQCAYLKRPTNTFFLSHTF